jgi:cysteine-rich repeat protein
MAHTAIARAITAPVAVATLGALWTLAGCLGPATNSCGNGFSCPVSLRCAFANDRQWCVPPKCGNGEIDIGEACDDGNNISGDGCPADCSPPCGDGLLDPGEVCDDGASNGLTSCAADCRSGRVGGCGDGRINNGLFEGPEGCDDGNLRSHDGCSSVCTPEILAWTTSETGAPAAGPAVMVYDPPRGAVLLLDAARRSWEWTGGAWLRRPSSRVPRVSTDRAAMIYNRLFSEIALIGEQSASQHELWSWRGIEWDGGSTYAAVAPAVTGFGAAYDAAREVTVLVGRSTATGEEETWELLAGWRRIDVRLGRFGMPAAASPSHAMTYDPKRALVMLYRADGLWVYDGRDWALLAGSAGPVSDDLQIAYDPVRDRTVLYGLVGGAAETWEWDGAAWQRMATTGPPPRTQPAIAYDVVHRAVVLFGGRDAASTTALADTWLWDGSAWRSAIPVTPPARSRHAAVYDVRRATTLVFGGLDAGGHRLGDTWLWDGAAWQQPAGASPPARADHAMAYDEGTGHTLLFGGSDDAGHSLGDTWEWDGAAWHDRTAPSGPPPRSGHALADDQSRLGILLIGGGDRGTLLADQWLWTGHWSEVTPARRPPPRRDTAVLYDPETFRVELFGGEGESRLLGDVWQWDGAAWIELAGDDIGPEPRSGHSVSYDPILRAPVLFGGRDASGVRNDAWTWISAANRWGELTTAARPPARDHHAMVYDRANARPVLFGGEDAGTAALGDLWTLRYTDPLHVDEVCATGLDGDGDRKAGCDDPDCDGFCATCGDGTCEPFESARTCPRDCHTASVCGDWVCDAGENCASCPGDCQRCIGANPEN